MLVRDFEDTFNLNEGYSKNAEGFYVYFNLHSGQFNPPPIHSRLYPRLV